MKLLASSRWRVLRLAVFDRDGWRCVSCGKAGSLECDHRVSVARGGPFWALDNLQALCRACHFRKTAAENAASRPVNKAWKELTNALV